MPRHTTTLAHIGDVEKGAVAACSIGQFGYRVGDAGGSKSRGANRAVRDDPGALEVAIVALAFKDDRWAHIRGAGPAAGAVVTLSWLARLRREKVAPHRENLHHA